MLTTIPVDRITTCNNCGSDASEVVATSRDFEYDTCGNEFSHVACSACGLVYLRDRPAVSTLGIIYPPSYVPYKFDERLSPLVNKLRNYVQAKKIAPIVALAPKDALVIDVGCGGGALLRIMQHSGPPGWRLVGVDFADEAIENLKRFGIEGRKGRFEAMEWDLPPPDVIVMNQVIEHLDDPAAVVRRSYELLKPGGVLLIETPSVDAWDPKLFWKRYWGGWHTPRHWTLYTPSTLSDLLRRSGFEIVEVKHILSPNFWLQSFHHWMSERPALQRVARYSDVTYFIPLCFSTALDAFQLAITGKTSNFRIVGKKTGPS